MIKNSILPFAILCWPAFVHAEVLDKLPAISDMWLNAAIGIVLAGIGLRIHWSVLLAALVYPALWFSNLILELNSFDLGPAILTEAGPRYGVHAYAAVAIWLIAVIAMLFWKKRFELKLRRASRGGR